MPVIKEIVAVVGSYEKNGETKKMFRKVGEIHKKDDGGSFILLDKIFNPAALAEPGRDKIVLSLFDPKPKEETITGSAGTYTRVVQPQKAEPQQKAEFIDDDIPF